MRYEEAIDKLDSPSGKGDYGHIQARSESRGLWILKSKFGLAKCTSDWPVPYDPSIGDLLADDWEIKDFTKTSIMSNTPQRGRSSAYNDNAAHNVGMREEKITWVGATIHPMEDREFYTKLIHPDGRITKSVTPHKDLKWQLGSGEVAGIKVWEWMDDRK